MSSISEIFKNKKIKKIEIKRKFKNNKKYNLKLLNELKLELKNDDFLYDEYVIINLTNYLESSLNTRKLSEIKNYIYYIVTINELLLEKQNSCKNNELYKNINLLKNNLNIILLKISNQTNKDLNDLIKMTFFEKIIHDIFSNKDIHFVLPEIFSNSEILNYHNYNNQTLNEILYLKYIKAKNSDNQRNLKHIIFIMKYLLLVPDLNIDKKFYSDILKENLITNVLQKNNLLKNKISNLEFNYKKGRFNLTKDYVFTLDSNETKKFDDAFSIEKVQDKILIGIHIADVYSLFYNESISFDKKLPLRSYAKASLNKNNTKNSITLFIELNSDGIVEDYKLIPSEIYVKHNISNSEFWDLCINNPKNKKINRNYKEDKEILIEKLSLLMDSYLLLENSNVPAYPNSTNFTNLITNKLMMLAGCLISLYFSENNYPYIYLNGDFRNSNFSMENNGFDTGFNNYNCYGKVTSPIIDTASLISQILIYKCYFENPRDKELYKYEKFLKSYVKILNKKS